MSLISSLSLCLIIFKLNLFPGYELISFNPDDQSVVLNGMTTLSNIQLATPIIDGVESMQGNLHLSSGPSSLSINSESIEFKSPGGLKVISSKTGEEIFPAKLSSLSLPSELSSLSLPGGVKGIKKIRSPINEDMVIESKTGRILIRGNQGVTLDSKIVTITGGEVNIKSSNGSIQLTAGSADYANGIIESDPDAGIFLTGIPTMNHDDTYSNKNFQYKLCVCGKTGKIFKLQMKNRETTCADVRFPESVNPCNP